MSVALVDLDHFKRINDTLGHHIGDAVLRGVAAVLQSALPADGNRALGGSFAARMGGEEFLLVLVDSEHEQAAALAEDLRAAIAGHPWGELTGTVPVTASIGVSTAAAVVGVHAGRPPRPGRRAPLPRQEPGTQPRRHRPGVSGADRRSPGAHRSAVDGWPTTGTSRGRRCERSSRVRSAVSKTQARREASKGLDPITSRSSAVGRRTRTLTPLAVS